MAKGKRTKKGGTCGPKETTIHKSWRGKASKYKLCRCASNGKFTKKPNCKLAYK